MSKDLQPLTVQNQECTNLVPSKAKLDLDQSPEQLFANGQLQLWYQPVYHVRTQEVLHNEVLIRWQDETGEVHLPKEILPLLSQVGILQQIDRFILRQAVESLGKELELHLSVNVSGWVFQDSTLLVDLRTWMDEGRVEPHRLSIELSEATVAEDFQAAVSFIEGLKALGCLVILDNFASQKLTLNQCQQLPVDWVKLDEEFIHSLKTDPKHRLLAKTLLEIGQAMGQVSAKYIGDEQTLNLVQEAGLDAIQGNHLKSASVEPDLTPLLPISSGKDTKKSAEKQQKSAHPVLEKKPSLLQRWLVGGSLISLGAAGVIIAIASISHRVSHIVVQHGVINGRLVRLQSPVEGNINEFYARPGALVKADQVLAEIEYQPEEGDLQYQPILQTVETPNLENHEVALKAQSELWKHQYKNANESYKYLKDLTSEERQYRQLEDQSYQAQQNLLKLQGEIESKSNQLTATEQSKAALQERLKQIETRLQEVEKETDLLKQTQASRQVSEVPQYQAALDKTLANLNLAKLEYERFQQLHQEGIIAQRQLDQLKAAWESAEAEVRQAKSALETAKVVSEASKTKLELNPNSGVKDNLLKEATQIRGQIQQDTITINQLTQALNNAKQQLTLAQDIHQFHLAQLQEGQSHLNLLRQEQAKIQEQHNYLQQQQQQNIQPVQPQASPVQFSSISPTFQRPQINIKAPFTSVVYRTEREKGELVGKSESVLSLLDCNNLWVEVVISAKEASQLDDSKPVQVRVANHPQVLIGEIDLIQPITTVSGAGGELAEFDKQGRRMQVQALAPTIPNHLMGEAILKRVMVKIPPTPEHSRPQQLCGLGQLAELTFAKSASPQFKTFSTVAKQVKTVVKKPFTALIRFRENRNIVSNSELSE